MTALFAGLTTLDVLHRLDHVPDPGLKVTSTDFTMAAGGPATNAAVTYAALEVAARSLSTDEAVAGSPDPATRADAPLLLTALGEGPVSAFLAADLAAAGVSVLDATTPAPTATSIPGLPASAVSSPAEAVAPTIHPTPADERDAAQASSPREPAVSSIIEHPSGRMVASTNARLDADPARVAADLPERVGVVLIDGHNPALAQAALTLGVPEVGEEDPFARLETRPPHLRVLDGGSWKDWLTPLLGFVDIAVVSEDFAPPLLARADGEQVAGFLRASASRGWCARAASGPCSTGGTVHTARCPCTRFPTPRRWARATRFMGRSCGRSSARGPLIRSASSVSRRRWRGCRCLPSARGSG